MVTLKGNLKAIETWLDKLTEYEITDVWDNGNYNYVAELYHTHDWISIAAEPLDEEAKEIRIIEVRFMEEN